MLLHDNGAPGEVADRLLWRDARQTLERHADHDSSGRCIWCGGHWPCPARRLAERAEAASLWSSHASWARRDGAPLAVASWRGKASVPYQEDYEGHYYYRYDGGTPYLR
jgi:hypothetical protein